MIKFFRKIRYNLMNENKTGKYFKYAIGEIILVVIGILIALQINTWNQEHNNRKFEKEMMASIHSEFKNNLTKIKTSIVQYDKTEQAIRFLMSKIKASSEELKTENIDSLLAAAVDVYEYHPTQNILTEILSTGNLNLIKNDSLKYQLLHWSGEFNELNEAWETLDDFNQHMVIPYLTTKASMKNIDKYSLMAWEEKSKFEIDYESVFNDLEFENHLDNLGWAVVNYRIVLKRLEKLIKQIIELTHD
ncbi:hypothetical protein C1T31_05265 [Hanstruepera neustonica]|uniref:Uncharacterized protein n=1 Tax=Hanstruepera neustonica TaxID=1445657 RepID=A0A2K1E0G0_9FLAO|nr:DUF6090 family protein [Hanstruepera neustonica]PNQ73745.1 hypothetical protein C1T31_05265 [Hanstruepera neustonica]